MRPMFDTKTGSEYTRAVRKYSRVLIYSMLGVAFVMTFLPPPAHSFDQLYGRMNERSADVAAQPEAVRSSPDSSALEDKNSILANALEKGAADTCLPLLSSVRPTSPHDAMDRNQRSAGKAAALSLMLGVRFALTPTVSDENDKANAYVGLWQSDDTHSVGTGGHSNRSALAIAAFRQCQKQQALQAINGFRWSR